MHLGSLKVSEFDGAKEDAYKGKWAKEERLPSFWSQVVETAVCPGLDQTKESGKSHAMLSEW